MSTFLNTLISHSYTWRAATRRLELGQITVSSFVSMFCSPNESRYVVFNTISWPQILPGYGHGVHVQSMLQEFVSSIIKSETMWASLIDQCWFHLDRTDVSCSLWNGVVQEFMAVNNSNTFLAFLPSAHPHQYNQCYDCKTAICYDKW